MQNYWVHSGNNTDGDDGKRTKAKLCGIQYPALIEKHHPVETSAFLYTYSTVVARASHLPTKTSSCHSSRQCSSVSQHTLPNNKHPIPTVVNTHLASKQTINHGVFDAVFVVSTKDQLCLGHFSHCQGAHYVVRIGRDLEFDQIEG